MTRSCHSLNCMRKPSREHRKKANKGNVVYFLPIESVKGRCCTQTLAFCSFRVTHGSDKGHIFRHVNTWALLTATASQLCVILRKLICIVSSSGARLHFYFEGWTDPFQCVVTLSQIRKFQPPAARVTTMFCDEVSYCSFS